MGVFRAVVHRRVVVNLLSGRAVEGVLVRQTGPLLHVKDARLHEPGSSPSPVDGEVVIERSQVDFIQAL
jgi:hypothetical protein